MTNPTQRRTTPPPPPSGRQDSPSPNTREAIKILQEAERLRKEQAAKKKDGKT